MVCDLTGLSFRQCDVYARTDLLRPSLADAQGSGSSRRYSRTDVALLMFVARATAAGGRLPSKSVLASLRAEIDRWQGPWSSLWVAVDEAGDVLLSDDVVAMVEALGGDRLALFLVPVDFDF